MNKRNKERKGIQAFIKRYSMPFAVDGWSIITQLGCAVFGYRNVDFIKNYHFGNLHFCTYGQKGFYLLSKGE